MNSETIPAAQELKRDINWKHAFWFATGIPALVLLRLMPSLQHNLLKELQLDFLLTATV